MGGELEGDLAEALRRWFWQTTYTEYFTGMTGTQLRRAVQHVRDLATRARSEDEKAPELPREVRPLGRFDYTSVRSRALVLLLVQRDPRGEDGGSMSAPYLVGQAGVDVIPKIFSARKLGEGIPSDGPENRWIVAVKHGPALYRAMFQAPGPTRDAVLDSHAITEQARVALTRGDPGGFLLARKERLLELERQFVRALGLTYSEVSPPSPRS